MADPNSELQALPMVAGMLIGAGSGFAIWLATDLFVFLPVFLGIGFVLGLVFQEANSHRER